MNVERYRTDPVAFFDDQITRNELGAPFRLLPHQREVLRTFFVFGDDGRLPFDTFVYSATKKEGKTTINAGITAWWMFTQEPPNELKVVANDLEQAQSRTFRTLTRLLQNNRRCGTASPTTRLRS